ncbi:hypothetical protein EsH8_V_001010 [Colletotrichum jinshuiense]
MTIIIVLCPSLPAHTFLSAFHVIITMGEVPTQSNSSPSRLSGTGLPRHGDKPVSLPAWALSATANTKHLSQPWKAHYASEPDDPNFAAEKDTVVYYDRKIKVCYSEGSMAA